jgi:hypothetical protein
MQRKATTVYHVYFYDETLPKQDYYFGSISAIYEVFTRKQIGIQASSLYNFKLDENRNPVYENRICRIRKDVLISKSQVYLHLQDGKE